MLSDDSLTPRSGIKFRYPIGCKCKKTTHPRLENSFFFLTKDSGYQSLFQELTYEKANKIQSAAGYR